MHTFRLMWAMLLWLHATFIYELHAAKIVKVSYDWSELQSNTEGHIFVAHDVHYIVSKILTFSRWLNFLEAYLVS